MNQPTQPAPIETDEPDPIAEEGVPRLGFLTTWTSVGKTVLPKDFRWDTLQIVNAWLPLSVASWRATPAAFGDDLPGRGHRAIVQRAVEDHRRRAILNLMTQGEGGGVLLLRWRPKVGRKAPHDTKTTATVARPAQLSWIWLTRDAFSGFDGGLTLFENVRKAWAVWSQIHDTHDHPLYVAVSSFLNHGLDTLCRHATVFADAASVKNSALLDIQIPTAFTAERALVEPMLQAAQLSDLSNLPASGAPPRQKAKGMNRHRRCLSALDRMDSMSLPTSLLQASGKMVLSENKSLIQSIQSQAAVAAPDALFNDVPIELHINEFLITLKDCHLRVLNRLTAVRQWSASKELLKVKELLLKARDQRDPHPSVIAHLNYLRREVAQVYQKAWEPTLWGNLLLDEALLSSVAAGVDLPQSIHDLFTAGVIAPADAQRAVQYELIKAENDIQFLNRQPEPFTQPAPLQSEDPEAMIGPRSEAYRFVPKAKDVDGEDAPRPVFVRKSQQNVNPAWLADDGTREAQRLENWAAWEARPDWAQTQNHDGEPVFPGARDKLLNELQESGVSEAERMLLVQVALMKEPDSLRDAMKPDLHRERQEAALVFEKARLDQYRVYSTKRYS